MKSRFSGLSEDKEGLLICGAAFFRSVATGYLGVVLAISLASIGLDVAQIGMLVSLGLAGNAVGTWGLTFYPHRLGQRRLLILFSLLSIAGGVGCALQPPFAVMALVAFIGMINGMGRDRGAAPSLEQALLPTGGSLASQTKAYIKYWVVVDVGLAVGSLAAGLAGTLRQMSDQAYPITFFIYVLLWIGASLFYMRLSSLSDRGTGDQPARPSPSSKKIVFRLAGLSGLDSLGGGFLTSTLVAYWLHVRFGVDETVVGPLFFAARVANIVSYFTAGWLSDKIGLLNTMVFTHLPSHFLLFGMAFSPSFTVAAICFLLRECLVEMDVPTRQSYLAAMVAPHERAYATGMVNLTRTAAWSIAPALSGFAMASFSLMVPLMAGGGVKILYDLLLLSSFRHVKLPK